MIFQPTRWWRVMYSGGLWCETSGERDARERLLTAPGGGVLQRLYEATTVQYEWRDEPDPSAVTGRIEPVSNLSVPDTAWVACARIGVPLPAHADVITTYARACVVAAAPHIVAASGFTDDERALLAEALIAYHTHLADMPGAGEQVAAIDALLDRLSAS